MKPETTASDLELLVFELAGHRYALELRAVREVVPAVLIAPLPEAPAVIEGVIDVRGDIVPVYDLRQRFGFDAKPLHPSDRLVVAWTGSRLVAFRCDGTDWIERVVPALHEPVSGIHGAGRHIAGAAKLSDGLVLIQDLAAFLDEAEAQQLDAALAERGTEADA